MLEIDEGSKKSRYILHERNLSPKNRKLGKKGLRWKLPLAVRNGTTPFGVEHVGLAVQDQIINFHPEEIQGSARNVAEVTLVDSRNTNLFCTHFDSPDPSTKGKSKKLNLNLKYEASDNGEGSLKVRITKTRTTWSDALDRFEKHALNKVRRQINTVPVEVGRLSKKVKNWYSSLTKESESNVARLLDKIKMLTEGHTNSGGSKQDKEIVANLIQFEATIKTLRSEANEMKDIHENIRNAKIVSAWIYFQLRRVPANGNGTTPMHDGETDDVIKIDVIRFDSRQKQDK